jgi:hypothetical protein
MPSPKHVQEYEKGWQRENGDGEGASSSAARRGIGESHFVFLGVLLTR